MKIYLTKDIGGVETIFDLEPELFEYWVDGKPRHYWDGVGGIEVPRGTIARILGHPVAEGCCESYSWEE